MIIFILFVGIFFGIVFACRLVMNNQRIENKEREMIGAKKSNLKRILNIVVFVGLIVVVKDVTD